MKKLKFTCTNCQAKLRVPTHLAGVSAPCPKCGDTITAPSDVTLAEEDEPSSAEHESAIQKEPVHAGASARTSATSNVAGGRGGVAVSNKAAAPAQQPRTRVVSSAPPAPVPAASSASVDEEVEDVVQRPSYGQQIPVPIPPAPTPAQLAEATLDEERSAAEAPPEIQENEMPVSLDDIAVSEPVAPAPEAAQPSATKLMEETQQIRVNAQPRHLPDSTAAPAAEGGDLPRLDVTLGEQNAATAAEMLSPDGITPREPTKVQLPSPGDESRQFAPDDFIIPGTVEEPAAPAVQQEEAPVISEPVADLPDMPEDPGLVDFSSDQFDSSLLQPIDLTPQSGEVEPAPAQPDAAQTETPSVESASVSEMLGLDGFEPEYQPTTPPVPPIPTEEPVQEMSAGPEMPGVSATPEFQQPVEMPASETPLEQPGTGLEEPYGFEPSPATSPVPEAAPQGTPEQFSAPVNQGIEEPVSPNPIAASAGSVPAEQPQPQAEPATQTRSEADVLDDMFGGSDSGGNLGLNIKLLIIAGAALLATVAVFLAVNALGGWSVDDPSKTETAIKPITPEKSVAPEKPEVVLTPDPATGTSAAEPSIAGAPAVVDPVAQDPAAEASRVGSTIAMPGDTSTPVKIMDSSGNLKDPVKTATDSIKSAQDSVGAGLNEATAKVDSAALSFDEKVQSIVNGGDSGMAVIGGTEPGNSLDAGTGGSAAPTTPAAGGASAAGTVKNYNPEPSYPAPAADDDSPLGKTHELIDAFLRAPDWETRLRYTYQGESLKPAVESYYQKWAERPVDRFSLQLFQMETDAEMGGPYWVYLISTSDEDQGFPLIVRVEDGNLKVDWEIFSEFYDRHFERFREGKIPGPATFRLVIERMSDYYGADRDGFKDLDDYFVYQINPPYGDLNEFSEYAFVKKDSAVAKSLDAVVGLGEEPLAVILTLDKSSFAHGIKHFVISEYVTEGWFR